jgi:hypothetical protein
MRSIIVPTLIAALAIGAAAPAAASAGTEPAGPQMAAKHAKKKRKAVRCRKSQVPIKLKRRTVGCRSLRAALPAPREGDTRQLLATSMLDDDLRGLRDRRGRRAPSLAKLFRKVGPRARRTVQQAIPQGLARLDRLAATPARASAARGLASCAGGATPTQTDSYTSRSSGQTMTATVSLGAVGRLDLRLDAGGYTISVRFTADECSHFDAPACPTAAGVVDATDRSAYKISLAVAKGDTVLMSQSVAFTGQTRMHAEVGEDARLDLIDIDDTQTANIELGGTGQQFGPVNLIYTGIHQTRVDMPGAAYVPGRSAVDISLTTRGVTVGRSALGQVGNNIARDLDDSFAALVKTEIGNFQRLEKAWNVPNACVKLQFTPASRTLKLSRGQRGSVTAQAVAVQGGGAAPGDWTLTAQRSAVFTPQRAQGADPRFSYHVTDAGKDIAVAAGVNVISKAGVGEATWEQETEDAPLYRGTLTAMTDYNVPGECGAASRWTYSARLGPLSGPDQHFAILDPASPGLGGARGYDETGSGTSTVAPCHGRTGCSTSLFLPAASGNGRVMFSSDGGETVEASVDVHFSHTGAECGVWLQALGATFAWSLIGDETITLELTFGSHPISGTLTLTRVD